MIKLPKYFNSSDYLELNGDIRNFKTTNISSHFVQYGHSENRKYNKTANSNYPFKLYLMDIYKYSYDYFDDLIIDFKINNDTKIIYEQFISNFNVQYQNISIYNLINQILCDNYEFIDKGIYSDRDFARNFSYNKLHNLFYKYIKHPDFFKKITNPNNDNDVVLPISDIFSITNKFRFFYEFFKLSTHYIKKTGFEIKNSVNNKKTAVIIETRNHILLTHVIHNIMFNLGNDWNLHIFCGYDNENYVKSEFPNVKITLLPFYNLSVDIYDFICMNKFFWENINTEDILIFQTDTYLINSINSNIFNYAYIGAPHSNVHGGTSYLTPFNFGLNGGLSFRKKSAMLECINNITPNDINLYRIKFKCGEIRRTPIFQNDIDSSYFMSVFKTNINDLKYDLIYEDVYFSHATEMLKYPLPQDFVAKHFILQENIYGNIFNISGVHGWDKKYMDLDYHKKTLKKYLVKCVDKKYSFLNKLKQTNICNEVINVLVICHNLKGGTEKYVRDVININKTNIKNNHPEKNLNFDILRIHKSNKNATFFSLNNINHKILPGSNNIFSNKIYDIIHIHYFNEPAFILYEHLIDIIFNNRFRPKLIITLHDYHFIINNEENEYHLTIFDSDINSLNKLKFSDENIIPYSKYKKLFIEANLIVTGSFTLKNIYNHIFDLDQNLIKVTSHPENIYFEPIKNKLKSHTLNIGIIGAISVSKGSYIIQDVSNHIKKTNIPWKIFHIGSGFNYSNGKPHNIYNIGPYSSESELKEILIKHNINLLWFPAFRHESFCYTLTLAIQSGLPIIAYDSGTFKERLSTYKSPYFIHTCKYNYIELYDDIYNFWQSLLNNNYAKPNNKITKYDDLDYSTIYYS
jgi:hypothetical protein